LFRRQPGVGNTLIDLVNERLRGLGLVGSARVHDFSEYSEHCKTVHDSSESCQVAQRHNRNMTNRLAAATSPYLLQHAENPVDWWEWSEEAFAEARRRDVPVFLSIGYSACHWCHVMAHESFEDEATAAFLNEHFVNIKVDREERPDIDAIYMEATQGLTGHGGWPMSVFLDQDGYPFYAGTYFPPAPRHGMPSFLQLIQAITETWRDRRADAISAGQRIIAALSSRGLPDTAGVELSGDLLRTAVDTLADSFDLQFGGFGGAPKFPPSMVLEFLLREAARDGNGTALGMAEHTLTAMARGGMYDQLGGGFARYSVDEAWVTPHFEKMLYDNALLLRVYAHWWRLMRSPLAERVVRGTAEFLLREMRTPEGGFAAALDADSEGVEGKFYAWNREQLAEVLGEADGQWAADVFEVTAEGTFEHGLSTLQQKHDPEDVERLDRIRAELLAARSLRVRPGRDDKVVAAWNGQVIAALAEAGALFDEPGWIDAAINAAEFLVATHIQKDGRLHRTSRDGVAGSNQGVLDDYGNTAEGFLALYAVTGDAGWLDRAGTILRFALEHFDDGRGGFYDTADDGPALVKRPHDPSDNAEPSGWFATCHALLTYAAITEDQELRERALQGLAMAGVFADRAPRAAGWGLAALSAAADGPAEVTVSGDRANEFRSIALASPAPGVVIRAGSEPASSAMVCRHFVCQIPTGDPEVLREQLRSTGVQ